MSNSKKIIDALMTEDLYTAKKCITEDLTAKMGKALEEKLIQFGPTVFNEGAKPDYIDLDGDGNKKEPMKKAAKDKKKLNKESVEEEDLSEEFTNEFEQELKDLVEEIEKETGEQLSEEEIIELANELLDVISEEAEDEDEDEKPAPKAAKSGFNPRNTGGEAY
jgi:hypothetical protein